MRHGAHVIDAQRRIVARHVSGLPYAFESRLAEHFRERFEVVAVLVRLEQIGRLDPDAGLGEEVLESGRVFGPPVPGFTAAGEEQAIIR